MKRTLIVEISGQIPLDGELEAAYDALSPEKQAEKLRELTKDAEAVLFAEMDEGAVVTAKVYVKEDEN
ncbi:hypothetical protein M3231_15270 [Neobacillus mesonae]|nr:hypothetical protein [Neobacillus mesonae]